MAVAATQALSAERRAFVGQSLQLRKASQQPLLKAVRRSSPVRAALAEPQAKPASSSKDTIIRIGILGASGYTGSEIARLARLHPNFKIELLTANRQAGTTMNQSFAHLFAEDLPVMVTTDAAEWDAVDAVFCCLPHATTQEILKKVPERIKIVDLSADFRLRDPKEYEVWYGHPHAALELQQTAVYGLTELYREQIKDARLVANPGCYPTSVQLPLSPLYAANLITAEDVIIDAKSGVSGAGRAAKESTLYVEIAEGINAYGVTKHRHVPEIEQGLKDFADKDITVSFTPHLMPMARGMQSTIYVKLEKGVTADDLRTTLSAKYADEEFVKVMPKGAIPHTRHVRGSNYALIAVFEDRIPGRAIIISVIDNLMKGASGQAIQNLNLMTGIPETTGLLQLPMFP